jgi:hypothetical protein
MSCEIEERSLRSLFTFSKTRPISLDFLRDFISCAAANKGSDAALVIGSGVMSKTAAAAVSLSPPSLRARASSLSSLLVFLRSRSFLNFALSTRVFENPERKTESPLRRASSAVDKLEVFARKFVLIGHCQLMG